MSELEKAIEREGKAEEFKTMLQSIIIDERRRLFSELREDMDKFFEGNSAETRIERLEARVCALHDVLYRIRDILP